MRNSKELMRTSPASAAQPDAVICSPTGGATIRCVCCIAAKEAAGRMRTAHTSTLAGSASLLLLLQALSASGQAVAHLHT
jgi:hypothetical protein